MAGAAAMISTTAAIAIWLAASVGVSVLARTGMTARIAFAFTLVLLPLPWLVTAPDEQRVLLAAAVGFLLMSAADFAAGRRPVTVGGRLAYVLAFSVLIDAMTAVRVERRFETRTAARIILQIVCCVGAIAVWGAVAAFPSALRIVSRLLIATALIVLAAELNNGIPRLASMALGIQFGPPHDQPYRSRTLVDFWSRRWNRTAGRWFRGHVFVPLRGKSTIAALFSLFGLSAAMHVYLIASVVPVTWMLLCALFFLVQPVLLLAERRLRVSRWPVVAGRLWTMTLLVALLPLLLIALGVEL